MKILIIRFSSIGDIVLTTPVIRCVKQQIPNANVQVLTKPAYQSILQNNPYISKLHLLSKNINTTIQQLRAEQFNYILDLHNNLRSLRIKKALKNVPAASFNKLNFQKWLYTTFKINKLPPIHIVDRYLAAAKKIGVVNDGKGLDYFINETDKIFFNNIPAAHKIEGYIAFVIGASYNTKKLPEEKAKQLAALLPYNIILLGGEEESHTAASIAAQNSEKIYNACGALSLNESAYCLQNAKLVISYDTGLMHIAAAFKKPVISIWGNTVPAFGMTPYYGLQNITHFEAEVKPLYCRPCSKLGYKKCPLQHFKCMQLQNLPAIVQQAEKIWKENQG